MADDKAKTGTSPPADDKAKAGTSSPPSNLSPPPAGGDGEDSTANPDAGEGIVLLAPPEAIDEPGRTAEEVTNEPEASTNAGGILPPAHWTQNPVPDDDVSSFTGSLNSTESLSSSVLQYRVIHGRRYVGESRNVEHWESNDDIHNESTNVNHMSLTLGLGGKLFLAPLKPEKVQRVLDIGTGTGIWAEQFADDFPGAEVTGTDVSPIQSPWVAPNLKFEIEDCTLPWTFPPNSFDFVHMRWLTGCIPDWYHLFNEAFKVTKPGGWIQSYEPSSIIKSEHEQIPLSHPLGQWTQIFLEGGKKLGTPFNCVEEELQRKGMEAAGFVDIQQFKFKNPIGDWAKHPTLHEIGKLTMLALESDIEGYILFLAHTLGWEQNEIQVFIAHVRRALHSDIHPWYMHSVVWARKPE